MLFNAPYPRHPHQESLHEIEMAEKCVAAAEHTDDEILDVVESDNCLRDQLTQLSNQITLFRIQIQKNLVYVTVRYRYPSTNVRQLSYRVS